MGRVVQHSVGDRHDECWAKTGVNTRQTLLRDEDVIQMLPFSIVCMPRNQTRRFNASHETAAGGGGGAVGRNVLELLLTTLRGLSQRTWYPSAKKPKRVQQAEHIVKLDA